MHPQHLSYLRINCINIIGRILKEVRNLLHVRLWYFNRKDWCRNGTIAGAAETN